jgi:hypothetical protein
MPSPRLGQSWREDWKKDRLESEQALADLESDKEREEEALSLEEQLERSRNRPHNDPGGHCPIHLRYLSLPEASGRGCNWCLHGSREAYATYLDSMNLGRDGRPKKATSVKTIA